MDGVEKILEELRRDFDYIVCDSPAGKSKRERDTEREGEGEEEKRRLKKEKGR